MMLVSTPKLRGVCSAEGWFRTGDGFACAYRSKAGKITFGAGAAVQRFSHNVCLAITIPGTIAPARVSEPATASKAAAVVAPKSP